MFTTVDNMLAWFQDDKNYMTTIVDICGEETLAEKYYEENGPENEWEERHGFTYGPYETIREWRSFDTRRLHDLEDLTEMADEDAFSTLDEWLYAIKNNKVWVQGFLDGDPDYFEEMEEEKDPITLYMKSIDLYNDYCISLFERFM